MADVVIFKWNAGRAIHYQPKNLVKPVLPVQVALAEQFHAAVEKDPLLHQRIVDAVKTEFVKSAAHLDHLLAGKDRLAAGKSARELGQMQAQFYENATMTMRATVSYAEKAIDDVITDLAKTRTEYSGYQWKTGRKVVFGVAGVLLGGLGMAGAAATGGATLGLALVGLWRGVVDLCKTCKNIHLEAEGMGQKVSEGLKQLKGAYDKTASRSRVATREVGASVLNTVTQLEMQNIPLVKSNNEMWKGKLQGLRTKAHDLAEQLNRFLLMAEKAQVVLRTNAQNGTALAQLVGLEREVQAALIKIPSLHLRTENGLRGQVEAGKALSALEQKSPAWTQAFDKWFAIAVNLGLGGTGDVMGILQVEELVATYDNLVTAGQSINDIGSATNDALS